MELFDIVDASGCPTGAVVSREQAHSEGICHRTAHIWVVRRRAGKLQVLLQKRAEGKDSFPGCYDTSSAGHIHAGDAPLPSALRELEEELGIRAKAEDLHFAGTFRISYEAEFHGKAFRDNEVSFVYAYEGEVELQDLQLQAEEVSGAEWFELDYVRAQLAVKNPAFCVPPEGLKTIAAYLAGRKAPDLSGQ